MHPQVITDAVFGGLEKDVSLDLYSGRTEWSPGTTVRIWIGYYERESLPDMRLVHQHYRTLRCQELEIRRSAIGELLETHNKFWNESEPIDAATFAARMTLETIHFTFGGSVELHYDDGDLFWGHTIMIELDDNLRVQSASFYG